MKDTDQNMWDEKHKTRVQRFAIAGLIFGTLLIIGAGLFSPHFVQKHFLTPSQLGPMSYRAITRARLFSLPIGIILIAVCIYLLYHPGWLLAKLSLIGKRGRGFVKYLPSLRGNYRKIAVLIIILFCMMTALFIFTGEVNEDEGWYLYASKLVYCGKIPYVDFAYTQPPVLPFIYGGLQWSFGGGSLLLGRIITAIFGLLTLIFTMGVARKLAGKIGSLLAGAAISVNPFVIYHITITKTYALSALLITLSLFLIIHDGSGKIRYPLAVTLLSLGTGVRLTVFPMLILALGYIAIVDKKYLFRSILTSGLTLLSIFLPFFLMDPRATYFNILGYHLARYNPQTVSEMVLSKLLAFFELTVKFPFLIPFIFLGIVLYVVPRFNRFCLYATEKGHWPHLLVFSSFVTIFMVHFVPGGALPEYHVLTVPLAAIFAGWLFQDWSFSLSKSYKKSLLLITVIGLLLFSFIGARPIHRLMDPRTSYINLSGGRLPLWEVSQVAKFVKEHTSSDDSLFTPHTYLALEAQREVLEGMEMGIFSFYPDWSRPRAKRYQVVNLDIIKEYIRSRKASALIITDLDFIHSGIYEPTDSEIRKRIMELIESNYKQVFSMDNFGQFGQGGDTVYVYLKRSN